MMTREDELALLIEEQRLDDLGSFQPPEHNTVPYGMLQDILTSDGRVREVARKRYEQSCAIHGMAELRVDPSRGAPVCRACDRERKARKRRTDGDRMRALERPRKLAEYHEKKVSAR
jgi:hypothetical protein